MTKEFIKLLTKEVNEVITTTFEQAPQDSAYPYAVITGLMAFNRLEHEEDISFFIDVYGDEQMEKESDIVRAYSGGKIISNEFVTARILIENVTSVHESDFDLFHKKISCTAKVFYSRR